MNIHKSTVFLLIIMAVLVVPIFYFVRWGIGTKLFWVSSDGVDVVEKSI